MHALAGANGIYDSYPIQRLFRDQHALAAGRLLAEGGLVAAQRQAARIDLAPGMVEQASARFPQASYAVGDLGTHWLDLAEHVTGQHVSEVLADFRSGKLRIASVPSVAAMLMPRVLQGFLQRRPDVEVDLVDTDSTDVRLLVETGQVDLGIASLGGDAPGLVAEPMFRDPFLLVCRADSALLARGEVLDWPDLAGETLILNEAARGLSSPGFRALAAQARFSVRNVTSLIAMVQAGMGVTLLPGLATANLPGTLSARRLADPACLRSVGLFRREGRVQSPVAEAFCREFRQEARALTRFLGLQPME